MVRINATKVLVQDIEESKEKTASGIIIPKTAQKTNTMKGKIILVGDGTDDIKINHKVGDIALFHPQAGRTLVWENKEYRLVDISEIFLSGA